MFKNLTINKIALISAALIGVINLLFLYLLNRLQSFQQDFWLSIFFFLACVGISFLVVKYLLGQFVFKNIQLIYKMIRSTRELGQANNLSRLRDRKVDLKDLDDEVLQWAERTRTEITDLKELETYRRNYIGNVSHELKTPIFSIQGYLQTLIEGGIYDENINLRYLKKASDNTIRLQNIVKDLEVVNKLESDASLDLRNFDISALTLEVFQELDVYSSSRQVKFSIPDVPPIPYMVVGDKSKIRQVLVNLLTNSAIYSEEGGEVKVSFFDLQDSILIEVQDHGIGIEEKHLKHLFDRFYRVDPGRSRKFGGSGLGLSIVKHILEAHNQTINVRSTIGVGSTFAFTLSKT